jgi:hypothetical protein
MWQLFLFCASWINKKANQGHHYRDLPFCNLISCWKDKIFFIVSDSMPYLTTSPWQGTFLKDFQECPIFQMLSESEKSLTVSLPSADWELDAIKVTP